MTRDEVMAMTDEQLRIKAAELMGWTKGLGGLPEGAWKTTWHPGDEEETCVHVESGMTVTRTELNQAFYWRSPEGKRTGYDKYPNTLPDYPNDWAAAGELLGKMVEMEWYPEIQNAGIHGDLWNVYLDNVNGAIRDMFGQDEKPQRAITMAFILATESTNAN